MVRASFACRYTPILQGLGEGPISLIPGKPRMRLVIVIRRAHIRRRARKRWTVVFLSELSTFLLRDPPQVEIRRLSQGRAKPRVRSIRLYKRRKVNWRFRNPLATGGSIFRTSGNSPFPPTSPQDILYGRKVDWLMQIAPRKNVAATPFPGRGFGSTRPPGEESNGGSGTRPPPPLYPDKTIDARVGRNNY